MVERIASGIKGFDELIQGGFPKGSLILLSGTPGSYKTIFCLQTLYNNALKGIKCLYINYEQDEVGIKEQMKQFGWDAEKAKNLVIKCVNPSSGDTVSLLKDDLTKIKPLILVVDSLASIVSNPISPEEISEMGMVKLVKQIIPVPLDVQNINRLIVKRILDEVKKSGVTGLLTNELVENQPGLSRDTISEFMSDGVIVTMDTGIAGERSVSMSIRKMRWTKIDKSYRSLEIGDKGLVVESESSSVLMK
ncbi:MAG: ATPase domain-containing protein [archaeon]